MNKNLQWILPGRVLLTKTTEKHTIDDVDAWVQKMLEIFKDNREDPVHLLMTIEGIPSASISVYEYSQAVKPLMVQSGLGWVVFVGQGGSASRFTASTVSNILKIQYKMATTMEDALQFLQLQCPDLSVFDLSEL